MNRKIDEQRRWDIDNDKAKKKQREEAAEAEQRVKARFDSFKKVTCMDSDDAISKAIFVLLKDNAVTFADGMNSAELIR